MPLEFPEAALEAIAQDCDQNAKEWGQKRSPLAQSIASKWAKKAQTIRQAIDAYREKCDAPPITRRQQFAALVDGLSGKMTPDYKSRAAGE